MKSLAFNLFLLAACWSFCSTQAQAQYTWTKDPRNPVLVGGGTGSWNYEIFSPFVLFNTDSSRYEMWFIAQPGALPWKFGFATSKDGASWTMYPSPVLSPDPGTWDQLLLIAACVLRENHAYKMWYSAMNSTGIGGIGYATSSDGIHWTKYASNPVLGPGTARWEQGGPLQCSVMPIPGGGYKMWYPSWRVSDDTMRIGYATSADGLTWQRDTVHNPVLDLGAPGQWDARVVGWPIVLSLSNTYFMWYQGQQVYSKGYQSAGVATSSDGITNWTRYTGNPVFTVTPEGWDQLYAEFATVLLHNDTLHAWYDGEVAGGPMHIGHAYSYPLVLPPDGVDGRREILKTFALAQNYPNPFNPTTVVSGQWPVACHVRIAVYDILGREVKVLMDEKQEPGRYEVKWNASGCASGVYVCRMTAGSFAESRKMILMK